ncbi:MAG: SGNH/GDSL hydrolase family protein [Polyangiales bacterium]
MLNRLRFCAFARQMLSLSAFAIAISACTPSLPSGTGSTGQSGGNGSDGTTDVVVMGDSLVAYAGPQTLADELLSSVDVDSIVQAAPGVSTTQFTRASSIHPIGLNTADELIDLFSPRIVIIALGTNDARILTADAGMDSGYTIDEYKASLESIVQHARNNGACVGVVSVSEHEWEDASLDNVQLVNQTMQEVVNRYGTSKVRVFDWNTTSRNKDWFLASDDIHHNATGRQAYRRLIVDGVGSLIDLGC